jgi:hypothetical protein
VAAPLYALPPSRFVAARDALARELAARHDGQAAAVRRLRRPVGLAWVMNRLARERADEVRALLDAATRLRAGQRRALAGEGAGELRAAEEEVRARARSLRTAARPILEESGGRADAAALARLELLLRVAASAPGEARDALREGVLEREPPVATPDLTGLAVLAGGPSRGARDAASGPWSAGPAVTAAATPAQARAAREGTRDARVEVRAARDSARDARAAVVRAARERARARKEARGRLARAEADARRAEQAARAAQEAARRAEERAGLLRAKADAAAAEARRRAEALRGLEPR